MGLAACSSGVREILLNYNNVPPYLLQCSGPSKPISTETLWCLLCCVVLELCRRADLTSVEAASTRRLPATPKGEPPSSTAGLEVTPPTSSTSSATLLEDIINPADMDPGLTANEAAMLTSDEIMYNPSIGRRARRLWRLFPETVLVALVGLNLPDRRPCKSARWLVLSHVVSMSRVAHMCACLHGCLAQSSLDCVPIGRPDICG